MTPMGCQGGNDGNGWSAWQHRGLPEGPIVEAEHNWALSIVLVLVDSLRPCWLHLEPAFYSQLLKFNIQQQMQILGLAARFILSFLLMPFLSQNHSLKKTNSNTHAYCACSVFKKCIIIDLVCTLCSAQFIFCSDLPPSNLSRATMARLQPASASARSGVRCSREKVCLSARLHIRPYSSRGRTRCAVL